MRVSHFPVNYGSLPSHTVRGLRRIGVDASGFVLGNTPVQSATGLKVIIEPSSRRKPILWLLQNFLRFYYPLKSITYADIIHWYFGTPIFPWGLDLAYVKALKKPAVVQWLGSDIRIPEIEFLDNPYYKVAFHNGYEYSFENLYSSRQLQRRFAEAGFATIVHPTMLQHVQTAIWDRIYVVPLGIVLSDYRPVYPDPKVSRPRIVHAPTAPIAKGTSIVLRAIEQLKAKYHFEFILIQDMARSEALELLRTADIFLDQFVLGEHGMSALEAMAFGKPVLCYIKPSLLDKYSPDCPIINANQDNLKEVLESILKDGKLRHETGLRSRYYVENFHDATKLANQLVGIYRELIKEKSSRH